MFGADIKNFDPVEKQMNRIQLLIIGRLMAAFLLLVSSWIWNSGHLKLSYENIPRDLLLAFLIYVGLTIVYFFLLRLSSNHSWQIRAQFFIDIILTTWLVWRTGDVSSPFITLYIVIISFAGFFLRSRETLFVSGLSALLFTIQAVAVTFMWIDSFGSRQENTRVIQIVAFHVVVMLVVGLLASRLSERNASGAKLLETEKSLINLRVLHERIVESIRSGLITTDLEGNIYTFNQTAEEITGYSAKDMRMRNISSLLGNIEAEIKMALQSAGKDHQPERFETDLETPDGFVVRIGYGISPLFSENNETTGLIITFQDLTQIRSMEESVRRKDRMAAVGRVAAGLAHEIRNPLGAMRGAIQMLESTTPPNSAQASLMEIIMGESDRLNSIITNFLTYARPRINNFTDTNVCEALNDTFTLLKHSPDIKETHKLKLELPDRPIMISADSTQLKQIFWNLARNSIQAMPDGGTFSVGLKLLTTSRVQIIFYDSGIGMSPDQVEQLFEPFSGSTTGGTGLGLSIVYQIVRDHNGTINVKSLEGQGTTITIELPTENRQVTQAPEAKNAPNITEGSRIEGLLTINSRE